MSVIYGPQSHIVTQSHNPQQLQDINFKIQEVQKRLEKCRKKKKSFKMTIKGIQLELDKVNQKLVAKEQDILDKNKEIHNFRHSQNLYSSRSEDPKFLSSMQPRNDICMKFEKDNEHLRDLSKQNELTIKKQEEELKLKNKHLQEISDAYHHQTEELIQCKNNYTNLQNQSNDHDKRVIKKQEEELKLKNKHLEEISDSYHHQTQELMKCRNESTKLQTQLNGKVLELQNVQSELSKLNQSKIPQLNYYDQYLSDKQKQIK